MRQLTLIGKERLEWREVARPTLTGPKAAIVRPLAVAVCDFDRWVVSGRYQSLRLPIAVGHEIAAEVVEVGSEVKRVKAGDRVVLPLHISCGTCPSCSGGRTNSCASRPPLSNYGLGPVGGDWGGGMSDLLGVPFADTMAAKIPDGMSAADCAAIGCNLVDMYRTIAPHIARYKSPSVLLVSGQAFNMALYGIVIARALGVERIDFLDDDPARLTVAEQLGARPVLLSQRPYDLHPVVVDCGGDAARLSAALMRVGHDGVCTSVLPYESPMALPVPAMFQRNATFVTGQPHAAHLLEPVLELVRSGKFNSRSIPVEVLPWNEADARFGFGEVKRIFVRE